MPFRLRYVHIIFSSVWVAEWLSFGKELLTRLTICSLCILTVWGFGCFPLRCLVFTSNEYKNCFVWCCCLLFVF